MATRADKLAAKARQKSKNGGSSSAPVIPSTSGTTLPSAPTPSGLVPTSNSMSFARVADAVLPFLSAQDQESVKLFLNTQDPTGAYKDYLSGPVTAMDSSNVEPGKFLSSQRAAEAITKLDNLRASSGLSEEDLGSGYKMLKRSLALLATYGAKPSGGMSRASYEALQANLAALSQQAQGDKTLAPYAELATKFINPTVLGSLFPSSTVNGTTVYGQANRKLFG